MSSAAPAITENSEENHMKRIESAKNDTVKELSKLHRKKERDRQQRFLVEGEHMVQEALEAGLLETLFILDTHDIPDWVPESASVICTQPVLNRLSLQESDPWIIGAVRKPDCHIPAALQRVLLLDDVQDPGNLGTLIRSACSFGISAVYCTSHCADPFGPKALQASQGAVFHIPVLPCDPDTRIRELKQNMPVFAAALHHESIPLADLKAPSRWALVLGNEGQGIREELIRLCTDTVYIEMDAFESLNVAVAGSILMYCLRHQAI